MPDETVPPLRQQKFRIIAQDPAVRGVNGRILTASVIVPAEDLAAGPRGHRVQVVDYDASTQVLYRPLEYQQTKNGLLIDPFENANDDELLNNPQFHAQNAYAIVMRILARFEFALGRRVGWGFDGHQLKVAPHAFADANAFYTERDEALVFGYFPGADNQMIFSCLSHDVVAHETTHALVDGLRERYTDPSSPDQAGFHEGFADVVALLSVFAIPAVVRVIIDPKAAQAHADNHQEANPADALIDKKALDAKALRNSMLLGLGEQMGQELAHVRGQPLRASANLDPSPQWYREDEDFLEPHRRGEILVAAMINAFLEMWAARLQTLDPTGTGWLHRDRVVDEGAAIADRLLTMSIRALDYCPPVHLEYGDFLSAVLTADYELNADDRHQQFRQQLRTSFQAYGIEPCSKGPGTEPGLWLPADEDPASRDLNYRRTHFDSMMRDPEEVFRFIWENRRALFLNENAYTCVQSVRPCLRIADDGFALRETVADYVQILQLRPAEIVDLGIPLPAGLPADSSEVITLYGGGALVFDEYGRVKFHVHNRIDNKERQGRRLQALVDFGGLAAETRARRRFSHMHRLRALNLPALRKDAWN